MMVECLLGMGRRRRNATLWGWFGPGGGRARRATWVHSITELPDETQLDEVKRKYRAERDKRVDPNRNDSLELVGDLARYRDDPYTPATSRAPVRDVVDAVVIGAGLGGLLAAARLREAGVKRIRLVDMAGDVGGVWYWNRYPGAMCDVEAYIYLPLLEELKHVPPDKYALAADILDHAQAIAKHYDLYEHALFQTSVNHIEWNEAAGQWRVETDRDDEFSSQYVVLALGTLNKPRFPAIPGIETFAGRMFHTSRWDYEFTGGDSEGNLTRLQDKKVAVVGTGATAIQCVPQLARFAERLYVVQRTPSSVAPRNNRPTDPSFAESLTPGWQQRRLDNFSLIVEGSQADVDLVDDGWTQSYRNILLDPAFSALSKDEAARVLELADVARMEAIRARVDAVVKDPATAEALKPYYPYQCKRPCFHDEYLDAFNRPNVELIDTQGRGIERIAAGGIAVGERFYELDALIFATGFELGDNSAHKIGFPTIGRNGRTLADKWRDGIATLHGMTTSGFPNLLIFPALNSQANGAVNWTHLLHMAATHIAYIVTQVAERGHRIFDVSPEAEAGWVRTILERKPDNLAFLESCTPGRVNNEGRPAERFPQNANFGGGFLELLRVTEAWRAGGLPGLKTE